MMAKKKAAAKQSAKATKKSEAVDPTVVVLAEQLGRFLGNMQRRADGWMESEAFQQQVSQIRDGASQVLEQVNRARSAAGKSAVRLANAAKERMPGAAARKAQAEKKQAAEAKRLQSRKKVAAPGKKHRKPPPQVKVDRHASQRVTAPIIQRPMPNRQRRGQL